MNQRQQAYIRLNLVQGLTPIALRRLLDAFGDVEAICQMDARALQKVEGITPRLSEQIVAMGKDSSALQREVACVAREGVTIVTSEDDGYPEALRDIHDPPLVLYVRGTLPRDRMAVAIVGSRRASLYGKLAAERLSHDLALRGITVVSGLARGIDAAAHRGALTAGGKTVAVLGSGLSRMYPPEHEPLAKQIASQGALISEYPMETPPLAHHFPRRNRIISGLSLGVVIVEAAQRSGALITADCALEQGREVFAVPGPISTATSQGTNALLKQGARLVTSVEDIIEELQLSPLSPEPSSPRLRASSPAPIPPQTSLAPNEQQVWQYVDQDAAKDLETITIESGLPLPEVSALLLQLELKRLIQQLPGKRFVRKNFAERNF